MQELGVAKCFTKILCIQHQKNNQNFACMQGTLQRDWLLKKYFVQDCFETNEDVVKKTTYPVNINNYRSNKSYAQ